MKMCQEHWDACQKAIEQRGLNHLVSKDGEELLSRMVNDLEGKATKADYDPLMDLNMMLTTEALRCGGLYLLIEKEDGTQYCPLCEASLHQIIPQEWIDGAADAILRHCKEQGMQG